MQLENTNQHHGGSKLRKDDPCYSIAGIGEAPGNSRILARSSCLEIEKALVNLEKSSRSSTVQDACDEEFSESVKSNAEISQA